VTDVSGDAAASAVAAAPPPARTVTINPDGSVAVGDPALPTLGQAVAAAEAQVKPLLASRTIWSLIVVGGAMIARHFGDQFTDGQQQALIDAIMTVVQGGGLTAAAVFRVVASKQLT
jgi:hypothetical protein